MSIEAKLIMLDNGTMLVGKLSDRNKSKVVINRPLIIGRDQEKVYYDAFIDPLVSDKPVEFYVSALMAHPQDITEDMNKLYVSYWASYDKLLQKQEELEKQQEESPEHEVTVEE